MVSFFRKKVTPSVTAPDDINPSDATGSIGVRTCEVPRSNSSYGDRSFPVREPCLPNRLSLNLRHHDLSYEQFRRKLKTAAFRLTGARRSSCVVLICSVMGKLLLAYLWVSCSHTSLSPYRGRVFTGQMTQPTVSKH